MLQLLHGRNEQKYRNKKKTTTTNRAEKVKIFIEKEKIVRERRWTSDYCTKSN